MQVQRWACLLGIVFLSMPALAQSGSIAGQVVETSTGEGIPGVNVALVETATGTTTDVQGNYTIPDVPPGTYDVQASSIGYITKIIENINIKLRTPNT